MKNKLTIDASNAGVILDGSHISGDWVNGLEPGEFLLGSAGGLRGRG